MFMNEENAQKMLAWLTRSNVMLGCEVVQVVVVEGFSSILSEFLEAHIESRLRGLLHVMMICKDRGAAE